MDAAVYMRRVSILDVVSLVRIEKSRYSQDKPKRTCEPRNAQCQARAKHQAQAQHRAKHQAQAQHCAKRQATSPSHNSISLKNFLKATEVIIVWAKYYHIALIFPPFTHIQRCFNCLQSDHLVSFGTFVSSTYLTSGLLQHV